ncbi:hypothetical protein ALC60_09471 [Trachymyrmex zeteki]|uniref:Zinc finger PHD-type domain-containing protein n=1 Tax=Mycetomoellerius zeteki TaxID=64791 RepID=A0A151WUA0_9HYME|nr:hypothetical protein ALC60_09471 [Trachymyrmex zeteki]
MRLVFNEEQENVMAEYLLKCSSIYFGFLPQEVRKLAYECADTKMAWLALSKAKKIIAKKGIKQVGSISAERSTLLTIEMAVSASRNTIPPMFIFPRLKYKDLFIKDGPPELIGAGNSSGWMTATEFLIHMDHFIKHGTNKRKGKGKRKDKHSAKRKILQEEKEEDNIEYYCIICCEAYSKSQAREEWIECTLCKNWAHCKCIKNMNTVSYICPNCDSGESCDDF